MHNYKNLKIYVRSLELATEVYRLSRRLPREEMFGLVSQMRRAAVSVALNVAEGSGASSSREFARYLDIARRSLYETATCLEICMRLALLPAADCRVLHDEADELAAMVAGFRAQLRAGQ